MCSADQLSRYNGTAMSARLYCFCAVVINGTVVSSYTDSGSHTGSDTLFSPFGSTHFPDGETPLYRLQMTDDQERLQ